MSQNFVYEHPQFAVNYLEDLFAKIEDKYIRKIDEIVSEVQVYYSKELNYEKCIHKIKELLPIFLIFLF